MTTQTKAKEGHIVKYTPGEPLLVCDGHRPDRQHAKATRCPAIYSKLSDPDGGGIPDLD